LVEDVSVEDRFDDISDGLNLWVILVGIKGGSPAICTIFIVKVCILWEQHDDIVSSCVFEISHRSEILVTMEFN
jgi:hypothetical protein